MSDRFANPVFDHRLAGIARNHTKGVQRRIGAFIDRVDPAGPAMPKFPAIAART